MKTITTAATVLAATAAATFAQAENRIDIVRPDAP